MNNEEMKDLDSLILSNAQAVTTLSSNLNRVLEIFREEIRDHVIRHCQEILGKKFIVKKGNKISDLYAQIWISHEELNPYHCIFGIESFSGRGNLNGEIFVGLLKDPKYNESDPCPYLGRDGEGEFFTKVWPRIKKMEPLKEVKMNLRPETIEMLSKSPELKSAFIENIVIQATDFIWSYIPKSN